MKRLGIRRQAVTAATISFAVCYIAGNASGLTRPVTLAGAAALALITLLSWLASRTVLWNSTARAAALLIGAITTGASGVLTLVTIDGPPGRLAGWCAVFAAAGLAVVSVASLSEARRGRIPRAEPTSRGRSVRGQRRVVREGEKYIVKY